MSTFSAAKSDTLEFARPASAAPLGTIAEPLRSSSSVVAFRGLGSDVYAAGAREAGRINASGISDDEHRRLLAERQSLLDKKFAGTMERRDETRLAYVRWSLDRIEDAKHGSHFDRLEEVVLRYERFLADLEDLKSQIHAAGGM